MASSFKSCAVLMISWIILILFMKIFYEASENYYHGQWRQSDQSISAMALVVFLPRPENIVIGPFCWSLLFHEIPRPALLALVIIRPVWRHWKYVIFVIYFMYHVIVKSHYLDPGYLRTRCIYVHFIRTLTPNVY